MSYFKEKLKATKTSVLRSMLETPGKFEREALNAARQILAERAAANSTALDKATSRPSTERQGPAPSSEERLADLWEEDAQTLAAKKTAHNRVIAICIAFSAINIIYLSVIGTHLDALLSGGDVVTNLISITTTLLPVLFSLTGILFFFKKEKTGWVMLVFDFTQRCLNVLALLVLSFASPYFPGNAGGNIFYTILIPLAAYGIMLYYMGSRNIMSLYKVNNKTLLYSMGTGIILVLCYIFAMTFL